MPTILTTDADHARTVAQKLLAHAKDPYDVRTDTSGRGTAFVVSDELAEAAGFTVAPDEDDDDSAEAEAAAKAAADEAAKTPAAEPKKAPAKKAAAPAAAPKAD
jgi:hypothetical protein